MTTSSESGDQDVHKDDVLSEKDKANLSAAVKPLTVPGCVLANIRKKLFRRLHHSQHARTEATADPDSSDKKPTGE